MRGEEIKEDRMNTEIQRKLELSLLSLRVGVFIVMLMWTVDKFVRVDHAKVVFEKFYLITGFENVVMYVLAGAELLLILAFLAGVQKRWSYGLVFLLHGVSTISSFKQYLNPFDGGNLLFFAGWPMLAACFTLYVLRDFDRMLSFGKSN
jgi:putative oxidoreductase